MKRFLIALAVSLPFFAPLAEAQRGQTTQEHIDRFANWCSWSWQRSPYAGYAYNCCAVAGDDRLG